MQKRTKLLAGGVGATAIATAVALTGGTSAFYYDLEQQTGNTIEACSFDLNYDIVDVSQAASGADPFGTSTQADPTVTAQGGVSITNIEPGDQFDVSVVLSNSGDCVGDLWADIDQHVDNENGQSEPEADVDSTPTVGELGDYMKVVVKLDGAQISPAGMSLQQLATWLPYQVDANFGDADEGGVAGAESHTFDVRLIAPEEGDRGAENRIMSDSYTFELDFALAQRGYMNNTATGPGDLSAGTTP